MNPTVRSNRSPGDRISSIFRRLRCRTYGIVAVCILLAILIAIGIVRLTSSKSTELKPPDTEVPLPPSPSILRKFTKGAVCSDGAPCSEIGRDILKKNGSAVDAAIATLFCNGVVNCQSMGLGGGFQMTIYEKKTGKAYTLNAREMAPSSVTEEMYRFDKSLSKAGALAVAVPGELAGYWAAHQRFGRLPWREVVEPTLKICQYGYNMTQHQYTSLSFRPDLIKKDDLFRELFINATTGEFHPPGTLIIQKRICKTLEIIAKEGGSTLYNGSLSKAFVDDIKSIGGIITLEDMKNYRVQWDDPVVLKLSQGITLYSVPPPGSGTILALILNILDGYNFNETSISSIERAILTDHRIVEAFKFAFAKRTELGDPEFLPTNLIIKNSTDEVTGDILRSIINDAVTFQEPEHYGAFSSNREDHGTAHVSVISPEGDAVSVTSTVNMYFGAGITSKSTGIVLNSQMDDFSNRYFTNYFGLPFSDANKLMPNKRPLSSMCPSILVDESGNVRLVVGAAGGTRITTSVAYVIMRHLWFKQDIKAAVDASRIHHQLLPNKLYYEYGVLQQIINGLKQKGHLVERPKGISSVVCAIAVQNETIFANADYRKGGDVHGF